MKIQDVEGIGPVNAGKLATAGVTTTDDLLEKGANPGGRTALQASTGVSAKQLLEWVNHVDLMRISGVGSEFSDLLEAAGVDSPAELGNRNAANLATTFLEVAAARPGVVRRIPGEAVIQGWIDQAKRLPKVVEH